MSNNGTGTGFSPSPSAFPCRYHYTISPLRHSHLSPPHEVCDSADQAAHYHTLGPKLGTLSLTWPMAVTRERNISYFFIFKPIFFKYLLNSLLPVYLSDV
jgi:hypothetical protein